MCDFVGNCLDIDKLTPEEVKCLEEWLKERKKETEAKQKETEAKWKRSIKPSKGR